MVTPSSITPSARRDCRPVLRSAVVAMSEGLIPPPVLGPSTVVLGSGLKGFLAHPLKRTAALSERKSNGFETSFMVELK